MSWENLILYHSKQHLLLVGLSFLTNSSLDDLFISLYIFFASNIFCLTLKCKKEKAPTSWRSLQTITYKYIKCILLHRITVFFFIPIFQVYFYFVDFLWILNIVLSLHIINCSFMLHFVITSNVFLQNSRWKSLFIHCIPVAWVSQRWLLSKKIDNQLFMEVPQKWIMQYSPFLL